jgi:hypothetical protein
MDYTATWFQLTLALGALREHKFPLAGAKISLAFPFCVE